MHLEKKIFNKFKIFIQKSMHLYKKSLKYIHYLSKGAIYEKK